MNNISNQNQDSLGSLANPQGNMQNGQKFLEMLYAHVSDEELNMSAITKEKLEEAGLSTWHMLQSRGDQASVVKIDKIDENLAVLQVVSLDAPFIVDSVINEMRASSVHMKLIVEPVIGISRGSSGEIIDLGHHIGQNEAVTLVYFSDWHTSGGDLTRIKARIEYVMECVHAVFQDWPKICNIGKASADNIATYCIRTYTAVAGSEQASSGIKEQDLREDKAINLNTEMSHKCNETASFIQWLFQGNFVFLALLAFDLTLEDPSQNPALTALPESFMGLAKSKGYELENLLSSDQINSHDTTNGEIAFRKTKMHSVVHRTSHMDAIYVPQFDTTSKLRGFIVFIGFFSSAVYSQSVLGIPIIKDKIFNVLARYNLSPDGYNVKEMITALQSYPRTELLQMSVDELYELGKALVSLTLVPRIKVFIRHEQGSEFLSVLLFVPKNRFSTDINTQIEKIICDRLEAEVSKRYIQLTDQPLVRSQLILKVTDGFKGDLDATQLEGAIRSLIHRWDDTLREVLKQNYSSDEADSKFTQFSDAFSQKYTFTFPASQAVYDLPFIEKSQIARQYDISLGYDDLWQIRIYNRMELSISLIMPSLQNLGLNIIDMTTYYISPLGGDGVYIHLLHAKPKKELIFSSTLKQYIEDALHAMDREQVDDDLLNALIVYSQMSWQEVVIIRAYAKYLKQIMFPYAFSTIAQTMLNNSEIAKQLVWFFYAKFGSIHSLSEDELSTLQGSILDNINRVDSLVEDTTLRTYLELINATKRTNYFLSETRPYVSLKIASGEVSKLPLPKPFREIFVYSNRFEGIHLRGGKISRGGIRWSDRPEDFRTEVLGLMKAQMTKNSVIVPVGSKGGFVLKRKVAQTEFLQEGIECYRLFLSGLLDVTDNIGDAAGQGPKDTLSMELNLEAHGDVIHPKGVLCYDANDPYLVVAADKGTASFSDYANDISAKYNFWLDDAFASGGSAGYDHKKMAITSKGVWISVLSHLSSLGINVNKTPITVVGIGDMSGDVFGNGLLRSTNMKLIAAFNHGHVFIDPNPDLQTSYEERLRLYNLPRSRWSDYNQQLISTGGGIFSRSSKSITITGEMREALSLDAKSLEMTPDDLIRSILMAPVDLLWNGGIGTYVKAKDEANETIGDKTNDLLRINGNQLRCRSVGEGGNLGFTQKGRIEYANAGGLINTDFIDNSAGVDCSDHEVNIKIAFSAMIQAGLLNKDERNKLLVKMTDEIADLVLRDNAVQTQLISLEFSKGAKRLADHIWLINHLEKRGELDSKVESLPDHEELQKLTILEKALPRPDIAVLISYAKNSATTIVDGLTLNNDEYMTQILLSYFPKSMRENMSIVPYLRKHKLANEIIATMVVNDFINTMGCSFFHQLLDSELSQPVAILQAFLLTKNALGIDKYWKKVEESDMSHDNKIGLFIIMQRFISRNMLLLLQRGHILGNLASDITNYQTSIAQLEQLSGQITIMDHKPWHDIVTRSGFSILIQLYYAMDIIDTAWKSKASLVEVANAYYWLRKYLRVNDILQYIEDGAMVSRMDYISQTAFISVTNSIDELLMQLTLVIISNGEVDNAQYINGINYHCDVNQISRYNHFIDSLHSSITFESSVSTLILMKKHLHNIVNSCNQGQK